MRKFLRAFACVLATLTGLPLAAAAPPGRTVTGIAVDPQGQPVAGAAVWLPPDVATDEEYAAYLHAGPAAVTGADGRFTVSQREDVPEIAIDVCASGSLTGQIDPGVSRRAGSLAAAGPLTVVVRPGARIFGRVVDAAGDPVAGVFVGTTLAGSSPSDLIMQSSPCNHSGIEAGAVSDIEGRFALEPLEPGWYTVRVGGGTVESAPVRLAPGQVLGVRLAIEHGAQVAGRVTARDGSPVPDAKVSVGAAFTTSDTAGRYRLTGVPPGPISVMASEGAHGTVYSQAEIAAGENHLDLVLPDPAVIRGRVLRPGGGPAAGATIAVRSVHTATATDGSFRLLIPSGNGGETLTVQAAGLAPLEIEIHDQPGPLDLPVIHLVRPGSITGRIAGLRAPAGTRITAGSFEAVADAAGRFRLPALAPGAWVLTAAQEGRREVVNVAVEPGAESTVDIAFPPTHRVTGWVVDAGGRPAACDAVVLSRQGLRVTAPCGAGGTFAADVEDGRYDPWVGAGGRDRLHEPLMVDVAGAPVDRVEIRLLAPVTVAGRILGLAPGEVPDSIRAERIGEPYVLKNSYGTADQDGGYRLEILPGDWEITAHLERRTATRRLHVPAGAARIDADLSFVP